MVFVISKKMVTRAVNIVHCPIPKCEESVLSECCICNIDTPASKFCQTQCKHSFCNKCISTVVKLHYRRDERYACCPLCRDPITIITTPSLKNYNKLILRFGSPTPYGLLYECFAKCVHHEMYENHLPTIATAIKILLYTISNEQLNANIEKAETDGQKIRMIAQHVFKPVKN